MILRDRHQPQTAVILAAGQGFRLGTLGRRLPKGFLELGTTPIVEESILRLLAMGIARVFVVTGHHAQRYEDLASRHPGQLRLVHNRHYARSGSMYSLSLLADQLQPPFLLLESDLIYERRALSEAVADPADSVLLVSSAGSGDEVWVEATDSGALLGLSKDLRLLGPNVIGELVGITKISEETWRAMLAMAQSAFQATLQLDYEDALAGAATSAQVRCLLIPDLLWAEIDDEGQLERARQEIYPRIVERDGEASWRL